MLGASYPTKAMLKASIGQRLRYIETSLYGSEYKSTGVLYVVGPDPYRNRKWYAKVTMANDVITKVS